MADVGMVLALIEGRGAFAVDFDDRDAGGVDKAVDDALVVAEAEGVGGGHLAVAVDVGAV